ncbi:UDP-glycosyltransferase UGT5-like [Periplaneta americana]|uniref:UDP-glycosyltransferase UGT5-like n=1 Tax=Periplaneta americana TaxID=6978 RepID=UPI0037E765EF
MMHMPAAWCTAIATLVVFVQVSDGANILAIFPFHARSHTFVGTPLFLELAKRGHNVTMISHHPQKEKIPNYTDIVLKASILDIINNNGKPNNLFDQRDNNVVGIAFRMWNLNTMSCDAMLQEEQIRKLIHSTDIHFDLVVMEGFFNECFLGFVHKFKAPLIHFSTFGGTPWMGDWVGNPNPYAYVPDPFLAYSTKMNFWERTVNTIVGTGWRLGRMFYYVPGQDKVMRKHFGHIEGLPSLSDIEYSTSLIFLNHHFSISYTRPLMPNIVQVGGLHVKPPKELPQDLKKYLDEATDGVIYFSMGSNLRSSQMPDYKRDAFLKVFSELKQRVLWKWETDNLPGKSSNVKISQWFPQSDILAHPNVRMFMTHGGLLSTQEALNRGVPLLGIPVFGDQTLNMASAAAAGYGLMLQFENITTESVRWAVREVLNNNRYRDNAQRLSRIYRDQPLTPMEQAVFWTEYVIRHKGARHMRSAALDLAWYQYFLLDVLAFLALVVTSVFVLLFVIAKQLCCRKKTDNLNKKRD